MIIGYSINYFAQVRKNLVQESKLWGAFTAVRFSLDGYYDKHGQYPQSLESLSIEGLPGDLKFDEIVKKFVYKTDGSSYELSLEIELNYGVFPFKQITRVKKRTLFVDKEKNATYREYLDGKLIGESDNTN